MATNIRKLKQKGYSDADISLARAQQEATQRAGGDFRSLAEVLAGKPARPRPSNEPKDTPNRCRAEQAHTEFDFFGGNVNIAHKFHDAVVDRLKETGATFAVRSAAYTVLGEIIRRLEWQSCECKSTASEISERIGLQDAQTIRALALLESVGAIARIKRGRRRIITVTPEGAYYGKVTHERHAEAVASYRAAVMPLRRARKTDAAGDTAA
jgi:hypothetical protein